jgi:putative phosphotransacetylase
MDRVEEIVKMVLERIEMTDYIPIEVSAKHIHISQEHLEYLFGKEYELTPVRQLSQPGEFLAQERIDIIGPKGIIKNVAILGPCRQRTQVELSRTDAFSIGVNAPIRLSGDLSGSETVFIKNDKKILEAINSTIVAKRHIHMTQHTADRLHVKDKQIVKVRVNSQRPLIFDDVVVRINQKSTLNMHIDYDEANSCGYKEGVSGEII